MPSGLFTFLQVELPFELGPPDGRWLIRRSADGEIERVLVLRTVGSARADAASRGGRRRSEPRRPEQRPGQRLGQRLRQRLGQGLGQRGEGRLRRAPAADAPEIEPAAVPIARATVIDPRTLADEHAANAWLGGLDPEQAIDEALAWMNRFLQAHRIAAADAYVRPLSALDPLALRAGFGEGEQVAEGHWLRATPLVSPRLGRRARRQESMRQARAEGRLAALLGGRVEPLLCEELALRARLDLDLGLLSHAAIGLERAYAAALVELAHARGVHLSPRLDPSPRLAELKQLQPEVRQMAEMPLRPAYPPPGTALQESAIEHALSRLEAALRAYAASEESRLSRR